MEFTPAAIHAAGVNFSKQDFRTYFSLRSLRSSGAASRSEMAKPPPRAIHTDNRLRASTRPLRIR